MRLPFRRSLSGRLTLWYGALFAVSLLSCLALCYALLSLTLRQKADDELRTRADTLSAVYQARGPDALRRVMVIEAQAAGERRVFFRLLYATGIAFSSSNMAHWRDIGVSREAIARLVAGEGEVFQDLDSPDRQGRIRVLYVRLGPDLVLQLGQPAGDAVLSGEIRPGKGGHVVALFWKILVPLLAFLALAGILIGWFMARKALSGLDAVTRTARNITGRDLGRRVALSGRGDEIDHLAGTFNAMLDRIEALVTGIREMSDGIAHDLKSPLTRLRGLAEVTLIEGGSPAEYEALAAGVVAECDRLLDMISILLTISRAEAGAAELTMESVDLADVVSDAVELFRPLAEDAGLSLECRVPPACRIDGDKGLLRRMIANLLDNAIRYTPAGGAVFVAVDSLTPDTSECLVEDTGHGISPENHSRVFERFFRCDPSRSRAGAGLGLSLVRAVCEAHGGTVTVESAPAQGSRFAVALPRNARTTPSFIMMS